MVVHNHSCLVWSPSRTSPREKYETMRWPSAYCATSSGTAIHRRRVRTQPDWPELVRTRLQSSVGTGFCPAYSAGGPSVAFSAPGGGSERESSRQSGGGPGGL